MRVLRYSKQYPDIDYSLLFQPKLNIKENLYSRNYIHAVIHNGECTWKVAIGKLHSCACDWLTKTKFSGKS